MPNVTLHGPGDASPGRPEQPIAPPAAAPAPTLGSRPLLRKVDAKGREIAWRKLNALEDFDLTEIAGANASNEEWMLRASIAFGVREIDGDAIARPMNKTQLRAVVARLDDEGMAAVLGMITEANTPTDEGDVVPNGQDRAKN